MASEKCFKCNGKLAEKKKKTPDGFTYSYFSCSKCGEEFLTMEHLHNVVQKYREVKRFSAKISRWGDSLAMRIPKALAEKYKLKKGTEVRLVPEKKAIRIIAG